MTTLLTEWCNIFGGENDGGAKRVLGGMGPQKPDRQWYCPTRAVGVYVMECEHGHRGDRMTMCRKHFHEFRDTVTFCPRCNAKDDHKCRVIIREVS